MYSNPIFRLLALFILLLLTAPLLATELTGKVVGVSDGDTLTLLVPDGASFKQVKVWLGEIDTPESRQPYGERAKQTLSDLAYNKQARVVVQDTDRYGRTVGRAYVGNLDVNAELVKRGAAWRTASTSRINRCSHWKQKPRRQNAACGRCPKPSECHRGSGDMAGRRRPRPRRFQACRPLPLPVDSPAPASGTAGR